MLLARQSWKAADPREAVSIRIHSQSESASTPALWPVFLRGFGQFIRFLDDFMKSDPASRAVFDKSGPAFLLRYHRNIYIYALLEACQQRRVVASGVLSQIQVSLSLGAPLLVERLSSGVVVRLLEYSNDSPLRAVIPGLWKIYYGLRTKSF